MNEIAIFLVIQFSMLSYACAEAYMEKETGWTQNEKWFKLNFGKYNYTAYHIFVYWVTFPLILLVIPNLMLGWNFNMTMFLLAAYLIGTVIEDFAWFIVNPHYPMWKWNPKYTKWYPWIKIRWFYLPLSYFLKGLIAFYIYWKIL